MVMVPPLVVMLVAEMPLPATPEGVMVSVPPFITKSMVFTPVLYEASLLITCMVPLGVSVTVPPEMVVVAFDLMLLLMAPLFFTVTVPAAIVMLPSAFRPEAL